MASLRQIALKLLKLDSCGYRGFCKEKYHTYNNTKVEFEFTYIYRYIDIFVVVVVTSFSSKADF